MTDVTAPLRHEHQVVLERMDRLEKALEGPDREGIRETIAFLEGPLGLHRRKEEELLFPALVPHLGSGSGPVAVMLADHETEKHLLDLLREALDAPAGPESDARVRSAGRAVSDHLRLHIAKEDDVLFPMAEEILGSEEKGRIREGMDGIGYCCAECAGLKEGETGG